MIARGASSSSSALVSMGSGCYDRCDIGCSSLLSLVLRLALRTDTGVSSGRRDGSLAMSAGGSCLQVGDGSLFGRVGGTEGLEIGSRRRFAGTLVQATGTWMKKVGGMLGRTIDFLRLEGGKVVLRGNGPPSVAAGMMVWRSWKLGV